MRGGHPDAVVAALGLEAHPEGGWFREIYRGPAGPDGRAASTAIYFMLKRGERSHWHRILDADEVWHHYAGAPLTLEVAPGDGMRGSGDTPESITRHRLGPDVLGGEQPYAVVPAGAWQSARSLGAWTLCGCTVAPGFEFAGFELAPPGWAPSGPTPRR